jgi:hypothetical protein
MCWKLLYSLLPYPLVKTMPLLFKNALDPQRRSKYLAVKTMSLLLKNVLDL